MDFYSATEQAYKNGYEAGYKTGCNVGFCDALKKEGVSPTEYRRLKEKYFSDGGEWLKEYRANIWGEMVKIHICSECGKIKRYGEEWAYCPACGSKMKGGDEG